MNEEHLLALLTLQRIPNLGDASIKKMLRLVGDAQELLGTKKSTLLRIDGIGEHKLKEFYNPLHAKAAAKELKFIQENEIRCLSYSCDTYPSRLKHCIDGPILLFCKGNFDFNSRKTLSVVGTRKVTSHGVAFCNTLIEDLVPLNPMIVSGFAYGVDITAHKAALANKLDTVAVLAHGLNQIYPKAHAQYRNQLIEQGGFVTDFWSTDTFDRTNFLRRNRIIAGISEATIVIESASKGGSLVTAEMANSYHREVFAVPGRHSDLQSQGCNTLIKTQRAHLLSSAADIIYILNWDLPEKEKHIQKELFIQLEGDEENVYTFLLKNGKEQLDLIAIACNLPTYKLVGILLNLELKGLVRPLAGKLFEAI